MVAAKLAKMPKDANQHTQICTPSQGEAAEMLNVSERWVKTAKAVQRTGAQELVQAVEEGKASVNAAADVATLPEVEQVDLE